jgi:hypothetical protein
VGEGIWQEVFALLAFANARWRERRFEAGDTTFAPVNFLSSMSKTLITAQFRGCGQVMELIPMTAIYLHYGRCYGN